MGGVSAMPTAFFACIPELKERQVEVREQDRSEEP
jgi:hypothetical protein